jgi:gliding motility-associated-like protein
VYNILPLGRALASQQRLCETPNKTKKERKDSISIKVPKSNPRSVTMKNVCANDSGEYVEIDVLPGTNTVVVKGIDKGVERACIQVCDNSGKCDTVYLEVNVIEKPKYLPVTQGDNAVVRQEATLSINIIENDKLNGVLSEVTIIKNPANGTARINADGLLTYKPNAGFCGDDELTYSLCNEFGCEKGKVKISVYCDELLIYSGFSPNGDGTNDNFMVQGIERFPNNKLSVFNRWGNQVYEAENYANDWDGTSSGQRLPDGTYFYIFEDGKGNKYSGYVQLQR